MPTALTDLFLQPLAENTVPTRRIQLLLSGKLRHFRCISRNDSSIVSFVGQLDVVVLFDYLGEVSACFEKHPGKEKIQKYRNQTVGLLQIS